MSEFPCAFSENTQELTETMFADPRGHLNMLHSKDYKIQIGMTTEDLPEIQTIAAQESIRNYCPKDLLEVRFMNEETTKRWFEKGRLFFLLIKLGEVAGYGWAGPGTTSQIENGDTTLAVRLSEAHQGQGLATPFEGIVVDYTLQLHPEARMWLEAWESNAGGVHVDKKLGFEVVASIDDKRPTASGEQVDDTRLYMQLDEAA